MSHASYFVLRDQQRIEARTTEVDPSTTVKSMASDGDDSSKFQGQQQIATSLTHLDKKKATGIDNTTMVRVNADLRENQRRMAEETAATERINAMEAEAARSAADNKDIEARWTELKDKNIPHELHLAIEEQKERCSAVLASKDAVIAEFHLELKSKDEEYVRTLKLQAADVEELLGRMRREFKELSEEYEVELESVEDAFLSERTELLKKNKAEVDGRFEARRQAEVDYAAAKQRREASQHAEIEDLMVHDHEEYSKLKIKLESDIQTLEQQLEEMAATYQLNTEKLEYNYRVLTERDSENSATLQQLKRKQAKLKETLSSLVARYKETDARDRKRNDDLTEGYRTITKQYKDLQNKFRHFEVADNKRFDELWAMHEEEVAACISKVLQADELITTQQLGFEWEKPDLSGLRFRTANGEATDDAASGDGGGEVVVGEVAYNSQTAGLESPNGDRAVSGAKMSAMMRLLVDEAQFLVDGRVKEALSTMSSEEGHLAQAESMLRALGVESDSEIASLLAYFFPEGENEEDADVDGDSIDELPPMVKELRKLIQPEHVVKAIAAFVEMRKWQRAAGAAASGASTVGANSVAAVSVSDGAVSGRREEKVYWARAADVVREEKLQVWASLEAALVKYNGVLTERSDAIEEVESLQQKNDALKELLHTYLGARVNEELIIPPNHTIQLGGP
jgi:dynein regulatory complex protein 1